MRPIPIIKLLGCLLALTACTSVDLDSLKQQIEIRQPVEAMPSEGPPEPAPSTESAPASQAPVPPVKRASRMPRRAPPVITDHAPAAAPAVPQVPVPTIAVPRTNTGPESPKPVISCDSGGCWGSDGRYNSGGGAYLDKGGKLCQGNGTWMQCF